MTHLQTLIDRMTHPGLLTAVAVSSVVLFVLGVLGVPWFVSRIPADYFTRAEQKTLGIGEVAHPGLRWIVKALKNLLGGLLLLLGIAMLVLPGQGVLTIAAALFLIDFPGKRPLLRRLIHTPVVYRTINAIRTNAGRLPLDSFHADGLPVEPPAPPRDKS
ncbi:MAG: hypothetical protein RJA70_43 [Pseudomonadota bacterium]|jgi:hypothetical protein